ncbi:unnamed protein product [Amoebophrya sp. A120]|nr:unnamed protein product [Amoebophrya sp. A120]|eukprot:GSA120T00021164001.1
MTRAVGGCAFAMKKSSFLFREGMLASCTNILHSDDVVVMLFISSDSFLKFKFYFSHSFLSKSVQTNMSLSGQNPDGLGMLIFHRTTKNVGSRSTRSCRCSLAGSKDVPVFEMPSSTALGAGG